MEDITEFEKIKDLGTQKVRKFNDVTLVQNKITGELGVQKHIIKSEKNAHLVELLREEALLNFDFPGLPKTLAFAENQKDVVLIRNYQNGITLNQCWKKVRSRHRIEFLTRFIEKLIPIFNCLEMHNVVHCDIKPTNILIETTEDDFNVSLIDFGMSIRKGEPCTRKTLFALGYSAPELILNKIGLVNTTTDIFSLGITIWQLYTGRLPLLHANPGIMTNLQITHPLPNDRSIPVVLFPILEKMCNKHSFQLPPNQMDPVEVDYFLKIAMQNRYQHLSEVLEDLKEVKIGKTWLQSMLKPFSN